MSKHDNTTIGVSNIKITCDFNIISKLKNPYMAPILRKHSYRCIKLVKNIVKKVIFFVDIGFLFGIMITPFEKNTVIISINNNLFW